VAENQPVGVAFSTGSRHVLAGFAIGSAAAIYTAPADSLAGSETPWRPLAGPDDQVTFAVLRGDSAYLVTARDAPRRQVVRTSVVRPGIAGAEVVVAHGEAVVTPQGLHLAKDALYVRLLDGGLSRLLRVPFDGTVAADVPLPYAGAIANVFADPGEPGVIFSLESWMRALRYYAFDPGAGTVRDLELAPPHPADRPDVAVTHVRVRSADGTLVPLTIVAQAAPPKDGSHPTILEGYGAYGISYNPQFRPTLMPWLERGGIYAICHARGGGEYGEPWRSAGWKENKPNTIADFIACAEYLVTEGYTTPARLAGLGGSAGGLTVGGAITRRPDLFAAAWAMVPIADLLRFEFSRNGPANIPEFGTVTDPVDFRAMRAVSPYEHIAQGTRYPAVLVTTGINDRRVPPWQAAKLVARLQAATASGRPVLLRVDWGTGHGMGTTTGDQEAMMADAFAFALWQMGAPEFQSGADAERVRKEEGASMAGRSMPEAAACDHLPRVSAPAALPNDNRELAGTLRDGVLSLSLEAREAAWHPEGPDGCALPVHAFAEQDGAARIPGPLIRVRVGTEVRAAVRNTLESTIWVRGLQDRDTESLSPVAIEPGATHEFRFTATRPGTFYYWATRHERGMFRGDEDGQLVGALVIDPIGADDDDRIFILTRWSLGRPEGERPFELSAINGLSWPHTERLSLVAGEPVRWRVTAATNDGHTMHLHGFYFRVLALGDAINPDALRLVRRSDLVVTEGMAPGWTMHLEWTPERPGNWLFHCHIMAHMSGDQRLDRLAGTGAPSPASHHGGHAKHDMAGLVLGITVHPAPGARAAAEEPPRRRLQLFASSREGVFGTRPGYGFVLQDGDATPAADSIRIPGTPIVLTHGEPVEIMVLNRLAQPLAVHWHGLELESYFDGVAGWSGEGGSIAPAIVPGDSFVVRLTPRRAGTFMYHVHGEHGEELASGLYGPLLVLEPGQTHDPARDLVFVIGEAGPGVFRGGGTPPFVNGTTSPPPVEMVAGETYRLRFMHIAANAGQQVTLRGPGEVQWRALARDGADYGPELAKWYPAVNAGPGMTYDFEFVPPEPGDYLLRVAPIPPGPSDEATVVPIRVRER
jgi:manganese oxidase